MKWDDFLKAINDGLKGDYYESNCIKDYPKYGDIICIDQSLYYHYGIYVNDEKIIHYAPNAGEEVKGKNAVIHSVNLKEFLNGKSEFYVYNCPKLPVILGNIPDPFTAFVHGYNLFTPEETVKRAESKIGEKNYNLIFNNCENFAFWCKTGVAECLQSFNFLKGVRKDKIKI